uniref:J domain-containing protein n=2 Tax=Clastoptera arizonana TaxID=38151 RepID=A0A1B6DPB3_9HEMI
MKDLLQLCKKYFGSTNLYNVLNIEKNASDNEVKKAYHKLSLQVHPDRVDESKKLDATEKFKVLGKIHSILSDKAKRIVYDETGKWDDEEDDECTGRDWTAYWRVLFKPITIDDIMNYEKKYKESAEELADLKRAYVNSQGDMDHIFESVPFTKFEEEPRLRALIQKLIDSGEVPVFDAFINEPQAKRNRRRRKYEREAKEAEKINQKRKKSQDCDENELNNSLVMSIISRNKERENNTKSFLDALEAKYANQKIGKKKQNSRKKKD